MLGFILVVLGLLLLVFFFQAEDGIRDWSVTGVQTCALPILSGRVQYNVEAAYANCPPRSAKRGRQQSTSGAGASQEFAGKGRRACSDCFAGRYGKTGLGD